MPHPSAYDPTIDDHHKPLDKVCDTLTAAEMCALLATVRDQLMELQLEADREKAATAQSPSRSSARCE
jgi:hypothetical protein